MISSIQSHNAYQPGFTSTVRISNRLASGLTEKGSQILKKQIKALEENGNKDLVFLNKSSDGESIDLTVYKQANNKIMENDTWSYTPYTMANKEGHRLVDLYNKVINETTTSFRESLVSNNLFKYL